VIVSCCAIAGQAELPGLGVCEAAFEMNVLPGNLNAIYLTHTLGT
jgi:hypothetical protein